VHRTADLLTTSVLRKPTPFSPAPPWRALFDGTGMSFNRWLRVSPGASNGFTLLNGEIATYGGGDFGLLYYAAEAFADFTLRVQFRLFDPLNQNSGIFVRFRDPLLDPPQAILDRIRNERNEFRQDLNTDFQNYQNNRAWSAVHSGFEIQIDDNATGDPRRGYYGSPEPSGVLNKNRTGAIYKIPAGDFIPNSTRRDATLQNYQAPPRLVMNRWYEFEIDVRGNDCVVDLTDLQTGTRSRTTAFSNTDAVRGSGIENQVRIGYIGLQSYPNSPVAFRNIQIRP